MSGSVRRSVVVVAVLALASAGQVHLPAAQAESPPESVIGAFSVPFAEPTIAGTETDEKCIEEEHTDDGSLLGGHTHDECKPAAGTLVALANGEIMYFNALEATEDVETSIALEFGDVAVNDQSRALAIDSHDPLEATWYAPQPVRGAHSETTNVSDPLFPEPLNGADEVSHNDAALFCTDVVQMGDGRVLAVGGTDYYADPRIPGTEYGVAELEGIKRTQIYDPADRTWTAASDMNHGRWYPSLVTLADGRIFVASGVKKLLKPIYPDDEPTDSGRNVVQTETFDPQTGEWTENGPAAERSLPLYPRVHLLPNGDVYYDAAGQAFNPNGFGYDEVTWNSTATYDPDTQTWSDLGVPGIGSLHPGFRGSAFSLMLPLRPDEGGGYTTAEFLAAGGVAGTSPGAYFATDHSAINAVTASGDDVTLDTRETGRLNEPRWYGSGVLLPDGSAMVFSGADRDEVVGPGTGFPVTRAERFDPSTETWEPMAESHRPRTYHNTAVLLPDGRVLVGGHAPISTLYASNITLPGGFSPNDGRDPSFEIYSPPYVFHDDRPEIIGGTPRFGNGDTFAVTTREAADVDRLLLVRNSAVTHLVDGDQRAVGIDFERQGDALIATAPPGEVLPPGPYLAFVSTTADDGMVVPSEGFQVIVGS